MAYLWWYDILYFQAALVALLLGWSLSTSCLCMLFLQTPGLLEHNYFDGLSEKPMYVVFNGAEGALTEKPLMVDQVSRSWYTCSKPYFYCGLQHNTDPCGCDAPSYRQQFRFRTVVSTRAGFLCRAATILEVLVGLVALSGSINCVA